MGDQDGAEIASKALSEVTPSELAEISFLSSASSRGLARIAERTRLTTAPEGTVIFREGDPPTELYVIRSGKVYISMATPEGGQEERRTLRKGSLLGELGILGGHERTATAEALEDTELWAIDREAFLELYQSEPAVSIQVASVLAPYLLDNDLVAEDLLFLDLPGRVAKRLLAWASAGDKDVHNVVASENMSKEDVAGALAQIARGRQDNQTLSQLYSRIDDLAMMSGGTRDTVVRVVTQFERRGLLLNTEGNIILIDRDALATIARL